MGKIKVHELPVNEEISTEESKQVKGGIIIDMTGVGVKQKSKQKEGLTRKTSPNNLGGEDVV